ncbi:protein FAM217A [Microcaecilia unicolor]|uniref:Protein FAM217A n=1 Tax=Microcaecilia unicolor TaxID=1415580 RepID=A0A6P7YMY0_9AMPH|nr:protein FAM217A [Microcaecilia unicolor]
MSVQPLRNVSLCVLGGGGGATRGRRRHTWCEETGEARGHLEPLLCPWPGPQDNYRVTVKQMEDLNLMENMVRKMQLHQHSSFSSKQQSSGTWSYSSNQRNSTENRNINKHQMEADIKTKETTLRTFVWNSVFSDVNIKKSEPLFYPEPNRLPSELHWSYDVFPATAALHNDTTASSSYPVIENNIGEALFMTDWNWNNNLVQNYLSDESDLSEGEKEDVFLTYSKPLDLSLRPEVVENIEESCSEVECSTFPYPDVLPEPFNVLDLPELASLKCEKWKGIIGAAPESSIGRLLCRLLQMEKMQYLTIQKEKLKASRAHLISATGLRSSSPKAIHKQKYSRQSEISSLQPACVGQYHEENSSNCYKHQQNSSKCPCQQFCHCKWASRTSSLRDLTTQPVMRARSACKPSRTLEHSNSHQLILHRPASTHSLSQIPQTFVEVTKVKLPSSMGTSYSLALRGTSKYKVSGRKKKPNSNKSKASNKLQLQRQNSLAVSCSSKQDLTQTDKGC